MLFRSILSTLFVAFEWTTTEVKVQEVADDSFDAVEEEIIPVSIQQPTPPPPPPPAPQVEDLLNIVEDDKEIEQVEIESTEDDVNTEININFNEGVPGGEEEEASNEIFMVVEEMPQFPGGDAALLSYIGKSLKYPVIAQENGIQGRVVVTFVIEKDGSVANVEVVRGKDPALDKEAVRVIKNMPKWKPGQQRGKPVRVKYTLPVNFRLQ